MSLFRAPSPAAPGGNYIIVLLFSPLGKLAERAIYFANVFFSIFLFILMVDILEPVAQNLMDWSSPKFQNW